MPQRPNAYNPYRNPQLVVRRRDHVLGRMRAEGMITEEEYRDALDTPLLVVKRHREEEDRIAPYFSEEIRRHLEARYGSQRLYDAGLQVRTTLDPAIQRIAERAVKEQLTKLDHRKGWRGAPIHLDEADLESQTLPSWEGDLELAPGPWYEGLVLEVDASGALVKIGDAALPLDRAGVAWTRQQDLRRLLERGDVAWFRLATPEEDGDETRLVLEQEPEIEAAALVLESATGAVRALVGGWDFSRSKFNRATQARRQVGSAFKPFVYGAALENGFTAADTLFDAPVAFLGADNRDSYRPRNYHRRFWGILTLRRALEKSVNVTSVKLLDLVGVERVIDFARRLGVESELPPYPSLALGSADLVPMEVAAAYAAISNHGLYMHPYLVEAVATPEGKALEEHFPQARKAMEPAIAYVLAHVMEGVVDRGTGASLARLDVDLAGKTGTTNEYSDAWFVGFTPRYTILTWVGYDVKRSLGRGMTGSEAALPIWKQIAETGLEEGWIEKGSRFVPPPEVTHLDVEYYTGLLPPPGAAAAVRTVREAFVTGTEPTRIYDWQWQTVMQLPWYQQIPFHIPKEGERMPRGEDGRLPELETAEVGEAEGGPEHLED
jgi:penicillin-binding protein 1A